MLAWLHNLIIVHLHCKNKPIHLKNKIVEESNALKCSWFEENYLTKSINKHFTKLGSVKKYNFEMKILQPS